jgi:hypothetical protein
MMDLSIPYYEDKTRISNSNIGWFLNKGPAFLHKKLTEDIPDEKTPALERGTMIHEYILQPEEFQKHYVVWDKEKPSSAQQEKFCMELAESVEIEPDRAILSAYKSAYSTAGKSEDKMLSEGLKIASTLKNYIDFLKANDGRIMISHWDYHMLEKIKQNIQSHKLAYSIIEASRVLRDYKDDVVFENHHEFHINWEWKDLTGKHGKEKACVQCKSLLDGLTLDFKNKEAIIYDLKTTQKLWHFEDSMEQYDYLRQLAYYMWAVRWYLNTECNEDSTKWKFSFYIIGIDTTGSNEIRVFNFTEAQMVRPSVKIMNALRDIAWHQANNKWEHSREYYEGDGSELLNL